MLNWLSKVKLWRQKRKIAAFQSSIAIDVKGLPEFADLGPTPESIRERFRGSNLISAEAKEAVFRIAPAHFRNGGSVDGCLEEIRRHCPDELPDALKEIRRGLTLEKSKASLLHNMRRYVEAGVAHGCFLSAMDERTTSLERELHGKRMTIEEARAIVLERSDDIPRSVFRPEVNF